MVAKRIALLLLFFCASILSGMLGGVVSRQLFLSEYASDDLFSPPIFFEQKKSSSTANAGLRLDESLVQSGERSVFSLYALSKEKTPLFLGFAVVGSADGWCFTHESALEGRRLESLADFVVVDSHATVFSVEKMIPDQRTGIVFLKVKASGLSSMPFSSRKGFEMAGEQAFIMGSQGSFSDFFLSRLAYSSDQEVQSSDRLEKRFNAQEVFTAALPVFSPRGELVGLTAKRGIIPVEYLANGFSELLRTGALSRPRLSLSYADLSWSPFSFPPSSSRSEGGRVVAAKKGVVLTTPKGKITLPNSAVIREVNKEVLNTNRSFSEVLSEYHKGDVVTVVVEENALRKEVAIILP